MGWLAVLLLSHLAPSRTCIQWRLAKIEDPQQPCSCVWQLAGWLSPTSCDLSFSSCLDQLSYEEIASPSDLSHVSHFLIIMSLFLSGLGESWFLSTRGDQLISPSSYVHGTHSIVPCRFGIGSKRPPIERGLSWVTTIPHHEAACSCTVVFALALMDDFCETLPASIGFL